MSKDSLGHPLKLAIARWIERTDVVGMRTGESLDQSGKHCRPDAAAGYAADGKYVLGEGRSAVLQAAQNQG